MATEAKTNDPVYYVTDEDHAHEPGGATLLGFWIYLMSDALIFATLFATFGVLSTNYAGGPTAREIFELPLVALNTAILLVSSITYGFAVIAMQEGRLRGTQLWLAVTGLLGIGFVGIELFEFSALIAEGVLARSYRQIQVLDVQALIDIVERENPGTLKMNEIVYAKPDGVLLTSD